MSMVTLFEKVDAKYEKLFFDYTIKDINSETMDLNQYKGKTILLVNVASNCGFTKQYSGLQELYEKYKDRGFYVIGVLAGSLLSTLFGYFILLYALKK